MASGRIRKQREKRKLGNLATKLVNSEVAELRAKAKAAFIAEFTKALRQFGSVEALHKANELNRPQSKNAVKNRRINIAYDFTENNSGGAKAYAFGAKRMPIEQKQSKLKPIKSNEQFVFRISNNVGNQLHLANYGFEFQRTKNPRTGKVKSCWVGEIGKIDKVGLIAEFPKLKSLFPF